MATAAISKCNLRNLLVKYPVHYPAACNRSQISKMARYLENRNQISGTSVLSVHTDVDCHTREAAGQWQPGSLHASTRACPQCSPSQSTPTSRSHAPPSGKFHTLAFPQQVHHDTSTSVDSRSCDKPEQTSRV